MSHCRLLNVLLIHSATQSDLKDRLIELGLLRILYKLKSLKVVPAYQWNQRFSHLLPRINKTVD